MPPKSSTKQSRAAIPKPTKAQQRPSKRVKTGENAHPKAQQKARLASPPPPNRKGKQKQLAPTPSKKHGKTKSTAVSEPAPPVALPTTFKVVAGSYEKLLYGLEGRTSVSASGELEFALAPIFIFPAHVSSVKAVSASPEGGKWLATGSADEIVKVWDLRRRREIGGLMHHEGSITQLTFATRSHLLSVSEDGTLALFRTRDWAVLRTFKGHKGRVNSVGVHPSGKLALSVGIDRTLRMWDLMRGKGGASMRLGVEGELVRWSTDGTILCVQHQKQIDLYSTDLTLLLIVAHPSRIHDVHFVPRVDGNGEVMLVAAEDRKITAYDVEPLIAAEKSRNKDEERAELPAPKVIAQLVGHGNRVKAMSALRIALPLPERPSTTILGSVSSDGTVHVYDLFALPSAEKDPSEQKEVLQLEPVARYDSKGTRLTCVALADGDVGSVASAGKRKRGDDEDIDEEEEEWPEVVDDDEADDDEDEVEDEDEEEDEEEAEEEVEEE